MSKFYPCMHCDEDGFCEKYSDEEVHVWCCEGPCKDERPSNADRIRNMTDEELAVEICSIMRECGYCPGASLCDTESGPANGLKKWLKQETD